jgi:hypothetical protein
MGGLRCDATGDAVLGPDLATSSADQAVETDDSSGSEDSAEPLLLAWDEGCEGKNGPKLQQAGEKGKGCCYMPPTPPSGSLASQMGCEDGMYCRSFRDGPADPEATCEPLPPLSAGQVLSSGTVFDVASVLEPPYLPAPVADAKVSMLGAVAAALNPFQKGLVTKTTDERGRFSCTIPASGQSVAVVAVQTKEGYFPSITGVISHQGGYEKTAANHDFFIVSGEVVALFNTALGQVRGMGKIGTGGGVIALVRDPRRGPIAGVRLRSRSAASKAKVAYLMDDGGFVLDAVGGVTGRTGVAVITGVPVTGEKFYVEAEDGTDLYPWNNSAGATPDVIFTMIMNITCAGHC